MNSTKRKQCRVCGDAAFCFKFDGLSCEACKVFFRRSFVKNYNYECQNKFKNFSKCAIDKDNRNSCKKCRLDKCLEIGMKKQFITVFNEKLNLHKQVPQGVKENNQLQDFDLKCIWEIRSAMTVFSLEQNQQPQLRVSNQCPNVTDLVNVSVLYLNKTVKYCKQIEAFNNVSFGDQLVMLKSFYPELCILYGSYIYNVKHDGLPLSESNKQTVFVKLGLKSNSNRKEFYLRMFRKFAFPMKVAMDRDFTIRDLLIVWCLFKSRLGIDSAEFVKYKHWFYSYLLWRYLKLKYRTQAERKFTSLMCVMNQLDQTSRLVRDFFKHDVERSDVDRVLLELFDLV